MPSDAPAGSRARVALAVAAGVAAMLLYAGQFVLSRWSMQRTLSLWDLAALRFTVAGLLSLPLVLGPRPPGPRGGWRRLAVLAVAAGGPYTLIMYGGLTLAPAAHGAVIITGGTPVVAALLVWLWTNERPGPAQVAGLVAIVGGLLLVAWPGLGPSDGTWVGDLLFALACGLWAVFTVAARRWRIDPVRATAVVWVLTLPYVPVYAMVAGDRVLAAPRGEVIFQALYQGVGVALVALALYAWTIRVLGAGVASLFMPLVPLFGVLLAIPLLGEVPSAPQAVGMAAVGAGMIVAARTGLDLPGGGGRSSPPIGGGR
jgi:drug/metabolite transporter (DMT)-like permease